MPLLMTAISDCCNKPMLLTLIPYQNLTLSIIFKKNKRWKYESKGLFCEKCKHHYKLKTCKQLELKTKLKNQRELLKVFTHALTYTDFDTEIFHLDETNTTKSIQIN